MDIDHVVWEISPEIKSFEIILTACGNVNDAFVLINIWFIVFIAACLLLKIWTRNNFALLCFRENTRKENSRIFLVLDDQRT